MPRTLGQNGGAEPIIYPFDSVRRRVSPSALRTLTLISLISFALLMASMEFAMAAKLEIQNDAGFAMRIELVAMNNDELPDFEDSLKTFHMSDKQGGMVEVKDGRYFVLLNNPMGAWIYHHAIPWVTSGENGWVQPIDATDGDAFYLRITPGIFLLYSLERPNSLPEDVWHPGMDRRLADDELGQPSEALVQSVCLKGQREGYFSELGMWSADEKGDVTFFGRRGSHLCSLVGPNRYFFDDGALRSYHCDDGWRKCSRRPSEDLVRSNALMTPEGAYWLSESYREQVSPWMGSQTNYAGIRNLLPARPSGTAKWYAEYSARTVNEAGCPSGYRLHYQGECINLEDEQSNQGQGPVRMVTPRPN